MEHWKFKYDHQSLKNLCDLFIAFVEIDEDLIVAQSILFFIGGSDSTAITLCFAAHELALHPEIQKRLQTEIDDVFEKSKGKVSYEAIMKMKYLDMVVSGKIFCLLCG